MGGHTQADNFLVKGLFPSQLSARPFGETEALRGDRLALRAMLGDSAEGGALLPALGGPGGGEAWGCPAHGPASDQIATGTQFSHIPLPLSPHIKILRLQEGDRGK